MWFQSFCPLEFPMWASMTMYATSSEVWRVPSQRMVFIPEVTLGWFGAFLAIPAYKCIGFGGFHSSQNVSYEQSCWAAVRTVLCNPLNAGALLLLLGGLAYTFGGVIFTMQCLTASKRGPTLPRKISSSLLLLRSESNQGEVWLPRDLACALE